MTVQSTKLKTCLFTLKLCRKYTQLLPERCVVWLTNSAQNKDLRRMAKINIVPVGVRIGLDIREQFLGL